MFPFEISIKISNYYLISYLSGVFFLFFVVMYLEVPATPEVLCSVHSKITWILFPFFAILLFIYFGKDYLINPSDCAFFKTAAIPFLLIVFIVDAATLRVIHLSSSGR